MIIKNIEFIPVEITRKGKGAWKTALGVKSKGDAVIVIVHADEGAFGVGEVSSIWDACSSGLLKGTGDRLKESVIGTDIYSITALHSNMNKAIQWNKNALCIKAGIEMAVYDLLGKVFGVPVYKLLGGKNRDRIPVSRSVSMGTIDKRVLEAGKYIESGYGTIKIKTGENTDNDIETIRKIRETYGYGFGVRVDANMSLKNQKEAIKFIYKINQYEIMSIEQPFHPYRLEDLSELKRISPILIMVDESVWDETDAFNVIKAGAADIINTYVSEAGGLYKAMLIANLCMLSGTGFCIGSMPELGIGTAAAVHLGIASPCMDHPSDVIGNQYFEEDIINEILPFKNGYALPIESPGLGVSLNWHNINRFRTDK